MLAALADGARQGMGDFLGDLGSLDVGSVAAQGFSEADGAGALPGLADIGDAVSGAVASAYSVLLPTADIANALLTTLPAYSAQIFLAELAGGNLLDLAATVGLASLAAGFELIEHGIAGISAALGGVLP